MRLEDTDVPPNPGLNTSAIRPKQVWWKWSLALTAIGLIFLMWQCGSMLHRGRALADPAVQEFHQRLNAGQYEGAAVFGLSLLTPQQPEAGRKRTLRRARLSVEIIFS